MHFYSKSSLYFLTLVLFIFCILFTSITAIAESSQNNISIEQARKEGIMSPPLNVVIGKQWTTRDVMLKENGDSSTSYKEKRIVEEGQDSYTFVLTYLDENKSPKKTGKKVVENKDGTNRLKPNTVKHTGVKWPKGRIKIGDSWSYKTYYKSGGSFQRTNRVVGFEKRNGYNCMVIEVEIIIDNGGMINKGAGKEYFSYSDGVPVYYKMKRNHSVIGNFTTEGELVDLQYL